MEISRIPNPDLGGIPLVNQPIHIQVDDRERNHDLLRILSSFSDVEMTTVRLPCGDFLVEGAVRFERKTAQDFALSLRDGRLFTQASMLVRMACRGAFILEGTPDEWATTGVSREAIQGALVSLMLIFDLPVLRSNDPEESGRLVRYAGLQLLRAGNGGQTPIRQIKAKRRSTRQIRLLQNLPGIGPGRARRLFTRFESLQACFNAGESELQEVEGIGPMTARKIVEMIRNPYPSSPTDS